MSTELARHKAAVQAAITGLRSLGLDYAHLAHAIEERINEALHPQPEIEEVEVVRWAVIAPSGYVEMTSSSEEVANKEVSSDGRYPCYQVIKLTGTLKRPKSQPVERTVSAEVVWAKSQFCRALPLAKTGAASDFQWEQLVDKTGTLTFTWTEDPK